MGPYQVSSNYSPGVKFTLAYIGKILEISQYLALSPRDTEFLHVALSSGSLPKVPKL